MKIEYLEDGSIDCPLVRIYGTGTTDFVTLRRAVSELRAAEDQSIAVHELPGFHRISGCTLVFALSDRDRGIVQSGRTADFVCRFTAEKWRLVSGLIEPFTLAPRHGHFQWLSGQEARYGLDVGSVSLLISYSTEGTW